MIELLRGRTDAVGHLDYLPRPGGMTTRWPPDQFTNGKGARWQDGGRVSGSSSRIASCWQVAMWPSGAFRWCAAGSCRCRCRGSIQLDRQLRRCGRLGLYMYMKTYVAVYIDELQTICRADTRQNKSQNRTEAETHNKSKVRGVQVVQVVVQVLVQVVQVVSTLHVAVSGGAGRRTRLRPYPGSQR